MPAAVTSTKATMPASQEIAAAHIRAAIWACASVEPRMNPALRRRLVTVAEDELVLAEEISPASGPIVAPATTPIAPSPTTKTSLRMPVRKSA